MKKKKISKSKNSKVSKVKKVQKKKIGPSKVPKALSGLMPLGDRVLVKPFTEVDLKEGGGKSFDFVLPESVTKEKSAQGKVLAVGGGRYDDGVLVPMRVKVGDTVFFSKYGYDEIEYKGEELYLLKEDNILAVIN